MERDREMLLSEFAANAELKYELSEIMKRGTLPHAIIIEGAEGTGKRTLADVIAGYCVCTSESEKPCGVCNGCMKAQKHIHPDIIYADGNEKALSVDSVRNIRSGAYIKPNEAPMKVYILSNCEKTLAPAQNAFLKVLEEPPKNVQFIMTVKSASSMLQTVRSRSRIFSVFPAGIEETVRIAQKRFPNKDISEIEHIAEICDGNIGMTLQMIESGGEEARKLAEEIFNAITQSVEYPLLSLTGRLTESRNFAASVLDCMGEIAADCVKASVGVKVSSETALQTAERYSKKRIAEIAENVRYARKVLNTNVNLNLFCTWLSSVLRT